MGATSTPPPLKKKSSKSKVCFGIQLPPPQVPLEASSGEAGNLKKKIGQGVITILLLRKNSKH